MIIVKHKHFSFREIYYISDSECNIEIHIMKNLYYIRSEKYGFFDINIKNGVIDYTAKYFSKNRQSQYEKLLSTLSFDMRKNIQRIINLQIFS